MRKYGEIVEVSFRSQGFSIYDLSNEYKIWDGCSSKLVCANSMAELKSEITKFKEEHHKQARQE
jgi:hypothetical protein